jgi:hypothetical protein
MILRQTVESDPEHGDELENRKVLELPESRFGPRSTLGQYWWQGIQQISSALRTLLCDFETDNDNAQSEEILFSASTRAG